MATTTHVGTMGQASLLGLPTELRLKCYDYLAPSETHAVCKPSEVETCYALYFNPASLSIRQTCKFLDTEFVEYLSKFQFRIRIGTEYTAQAQSEKLQNGRFRTSEISRALFFQTQNVEVKIYLPKDGTDELACLENTLAVVNNSAALKHLKIQITFCAPVEEIGKWYLQLTKLQMQAARQGRTRGTSSAQVELNYGQNVVEWLKTVLDREVDQEMVSNASSQ